MPGSLKEFHGESDSVSVRYIQETQTLQKKVVLMVALQTLQNLPAMQQKSEAVKNC